MLLVAPGPGGGRGDSRWQGHSADPGPGRAGRARVGLGTVSLRSGQVRHVRSGLLLGGTLKSRTDEDDDSSMSSSMRAKRKKRSRANRTKVPTFMSNELESARAMVMSLKSFGVDCAGYDHETKTRTEPPSSTNPQCTGRSCFRPLRLYVSCLSGLRFRNLGFCGHDLM